RRADAFAAQMQAPGGEGVAEQLAHEEGREGGGNEHGGADVDVAGGLEHEEAHGQRAADDAAGERGHADRRGKGAVDMGDAAQIEDAGVDLAEQGAHQQGGKEQAAAEAGAERDRRGEKFEHEEQGDRQQRDLAGQLDFEGAVAGREDLRRYQREAAHDHAAQDRTGRRRQAERGPHGLDTGDRQHGGDGDAARQHAQRDEGQRLVGRDRGELAQQDRGLHGAEDAGEEGGDQRSGDQRRQQVDRIDADDELEAVEGAGEGGIEGGRDGGGGAAADQGADFVAAQIETEAEV